MKTYTVIWLYMANWGVREVRSTSAHHAALDATALFNDSFRRNGRTLVFEGTPLVDTNMKETIQGLYANQVD